MVALPRDAFFEAARTEPDLMVELSRLMIQRARDRSAGGGEPSVFGFIAARHRPIRAFVEQVAAAIVSQGFTCQIIDSSALSSAADWFSTDCSSSATPCWPRPPIPCPTRACWTPSSGPT